MNSPTQLLQLLQVVGKRPFLQQSFRTATWIVERRFPAPLIKANNRMPSLRRKHRVLDVVQNKSPTPFVHPQLNVLLTEYVENIGQPGERVDVKAKLGRDLLLAKKAVYPTPDNLEKYLDRAHLNVVNYSSRYVKNTLDDLSKFILQVTMNKEVPWTVEPWHIRVAFRKANRIVPEHAITLPPSPIKGPDLSLQGKEFYVTVTINKTEKVIVRCRITHWTNNIQERFPWIPFHFKLPAPPVFEEDKVIAAQLPEIEPLKMDEDTLSAFITKMKNKSLAYAKITQ